ncbi:MAG: hypothetical protein V4474_04320 [Patescibacteria group bacterium]
MPDQNDDKNNIDLSKILLPKKEGPSVDSAQRINAGALLAQEQEAAQTGLNPDAPAKPEVGAPTKASGKDESAIKNLQTYQGDIESVIGNKPVSVVSIAAAEANRRAQQPLGNAAPAATMSFTRRALYWGGGLLLILIAAGVGAYVYTRPTTVPVMPLATNAPFIAVDDTEVVQVPTGATRDTLMPALDAARKDTQISLGLMERVYIANPSADKTLAEMPVQTLLHTLAPYAPASLSRTLRPEYLLGVHSFDENQAFLILSTDSYETAYAGMITWEPGMLADLSPLFTRTPPVHVNGTATTSPTPAVIESIFNDRVVENHDARVIQNEYGDILLLWTFLDRNTIAITTNEFTLREILARRTSAATLGLPQ